MSYPAPNFTQIPNLLLEDHIKAMTEAEMRVALAIARKTFGWHKRQDKLSLSQLMDLTGMSRQGVINGIEAGIARGIIRREQCGQSFLYELVILDKPVNEVDQCKDAKTSQRSRPALVNEVDQLNTKTSQRSRHTKERNKRNKLKKAEPMSRANPPPPLGVTRIGGGGGLSDHANNFQSNGLNGNHNGHHATTTDSGALRSPQSLSARSLATEWAADFAAGWASLEADLAGWTDSQIRCLLTWLYVWAIEADSQDRNLEPAARYDAGQRLATNYANVYAGSTNRIGLIKSKVAALIAVPLTEADAAALEGLIEQP